MTVVKGQVKEEHATPNYTIFYASVYWLVLAMIVICAILNAVDGLMMLRTSARASLIQASKNLFHLLMAHLRHINHEARCKVLQLAQLISVTLLLAIYGASFSNENIIIHSPKVYDTYKSLYEHPPNVILVVPEDIEIIYRVAGTFSENRALYLNKLRPKIISFDHLDKVSSEGAKKMAFIIENGEKGCHALRVELKYRQLDDDVLIMKKRAPRIANTHLQRLTSNSLTQTPAGKRVIKTFQTISQAGLMDGVDMNLFKSLTLQVLSWHPAASGVKHMAFSKCDQVRESGFMIVTFKLFRRVLLVFAWLLIPPFIILAVEVLNHYCKLRSARRKKHTPRLGRKVAHSRCTSAMTIRAISKVTQSNSPRGSLRM